MNMHQAPLQRFHTNQPFPSSNQLRLMDAVPNPATWQIRRPAIQKVNPNTATSLASKAPNMILDPKDRDTRSQC